MQQTSPELDTLLIELASIQDRLLKEPPLAERATLHSRQEELRAAAKKLRAAVRDDLTLAQAKDQLRHLEERRAILVAAHVSHADDSATDLGTGTAQGPIHESHARSAEAFGLDELEHEISQLRNHVRTMEAS
jgi:hypothetical protein